MSVTVMSGTANVMEMNINATSSRIEVTLSTPDIVR